MTVRFTGGDGARENVLLSRGLRRGEPAGGTGNSGVARGASASRGQEEGLEAGARLPATRAHPAPAVAAQGGSAPTPLASPPPRQHHHQRTASAVTAATAAPLTSAPSDLCGRQTLVV